MERSLLVATVLAGSVVLLFAIYLLWFGALAVAAPSRASRYLQGFASSMRLHVLELLVRLVVGVAFVGYASHMQFGGAFHAFGVVLVFTTLGLALLPWRWHQRIAQTSVPAAVRYLPMIGIVSIAAGTGVFWAVASILVG
jgi:uncharacterized protein YjeT (DUF2065 family)